jgi:protein MpaA
MIFSSLDNGLSVEGHEIEAFKTDIKSSHYLYLLAGTHGDEVEGVYVLKNLFDWLKTDHSLNDLPIVVIPILNIDGYRAGTRVNSHGVDLNRNYPCSTWIPFDEIKQDAQQKAKFYPGLSPCSEPENQFLVKLFEKYKPGFIISFHSWKPILNFNGDAEDVAQYISEFNHYSPASDIGYPTPGSLGTFVPEKFQAPVLTYECPLLKDGKTLKEIWLENEEGLKHFIQSDLLLKKLKLT